MTETIKNPLNARPQISGLFRVAIVGAATLKGKELKEVLEEHNFPASDVRLLDDEESLGQLEAVGDEATFIQSVTRSSFEDVDVVFFACEEAFARKHWQAARDAGCTVVDLSYGLETGPKLVVRSPWLDKELEPQMEKPIVDLETTAVVAAHPAATISGLLLQRAHRTGAIKSTVMTVFDPVSEQGKKGMDELHQQTLNLLSFQPMPKEVFDIQVAFNMVQRYGEEAKMSMENNQSRVLRHVQQITRGRVELPAMQWLQAPTFHGYAVSIYFELDRKVKPGDFALAFQGEHITIIPDDEDAPNNVNAAGQENIQLSLRADSSRANGIWLWATADNLRISALTAFECAIALAAARPSGKIQ